MKRTGGKEKERKGVVNYQISYVDYQLINCIFVA